MEKRPLEFDAFSKPIGLGEAYRFSSTLGNNVAQKVAFGVTIGFAIVFLLIALLIFLATGPASLPFVLVFGLGPCVMVVALVRSIFKNSVRALKLKRFAEINGFNFTVNRVPQGYPGLVFSIGHSQRYATIVNGTYQGLPFEFGNFYCTEGSGKNAKHRSFGIIEIKLTRRLPHMLLDSRANNSLGFSNLPRFSDSQHLTLEGNFNNYFNLYVPDGYERDALYIITPELMALLIDNGADFDIEIVDDRLYIYKSTDFSLEQLKPVEQIFQLITVLGAEVLENSDRYADANMGDRQNNLVAEPGRRLRRNRTWAIAIAVFFVIWGMVIFFISSRWV